MLADRALRMCQMLGLPVAAFERRNDILSNGDHLVRMVFPDGCMYTVGYSRVVERAVVQAIVGALISPGEAIDDLNARDDLTSSLMPLLSGSTPRVPPEVVSVMLRSPFPRVREAGFRLLAL